MKISEKNKNNAISIEQKPKLQLLEPGSTPQRCRVSEDQPRQHSVARRENNNLADRAVCAALPWLGKGNMPEILDDVDIKLLQRCSQKPGSALAEISRPLVGELASRTLYGRLFELEVRNFISVDRTARRGRALATITESGKRAITERERSTPYKGVGSP